MQTTAALLLRLAMNLTLCSGTMFSFHLTSTRRSYHDNEDVCRALGYDGLATPISPEMYAHALALTEEIRAHGPNYGIHIGIRNNTQTNLVTWDDGSLPAEDTPWRSDLELSTHFVYRPYGLIHHLGSLRATSGENKRHTLCGYHANLPTEAHGVKLLGKQAVGVSSNLSLTKAFSFMECVLLCGQNHRCRVAEFHLDYLTCRILGPNSYTGFTVNSKYHSFVRNGYA